MALLKIATKARKLAPKAAKKIKKVVKLAPKAAKKITPKKWAAKATPKRGYHIKWVNDQQSRYTYKKK